MLLAVLALSGCVGGADTVASRTCSIDPAAILSWGDYHLANELRAPNLFVYEGCGKRLVFLGAQHTNDPDSETYRQLRLAMAKWTPELLVLEGFPESMGVSPPDMLDYAASLKAGPMDSEGSEAIRSAAEAGADFVGGEPDDRDILVGLEARGFSAADLFASYVIRQIEQWKREQRITSHMDPALEARIKHFASIVVRDLGLPDDGLSAIASRDAVAAWYERTNGLPFDTGYRPEDSHPSGPQNNRATNALSDTISDLRDQHIAGVIARAIQAHETVLVVYGSSHHTIQARAFEAAFGRPKFAGRLPAAP